MYTYQVNQYRRIFDFVHCLALYLGYVQRDIEVFGQHLNIRKQILPLVWNHCWRFVVFESKVKQVSQNTDTLNIYMICIFSTSISLTVIVKLSLRSIIHIPF